MNTPFNYLCPGKSTRPARMEAEIYDEVLREQEHDGGSGRCQADCFIFTEVVEKSCTLLFYLRFKLFIWT